MLRVLQTHDLTFPNYIKIQDMWCPNVYRLWPFISKNSWSPYSFFFFLTEASPKTWKQTFPSGAHELDGSKIIFTDLNIMVWKWQYYLKKKPASLILVIQFTYKGWINNSKKLWSYFNETKAEKKCMLSNWTLNISII